MNDFQLEWDEGGTSLFIYWGKQKILNNVTVICRLLNIHIHIVVPGGVATL